MSDDALRTYASLRDAGSPQSLALGLKTLQTDANGALLLAPYHPDLVGDPETGVLAGGVITTLLDHACGQAVMQALGAPTIIATLDLRIDYMRAAIPGQDVLCRALCYKVTRSVAFVRAAAFETDESDPVATAQAAFMLNSTPVSPGRT